MVFLRFFGKEKSGQLDKKGRYRQSAAVKRCLRIYLQGRLCETPRLNNGD